MSAVADAPRIADLEHRIAQDSSSIAFAQLAEEYRRAGRLADAIRVCGAGLAQYPSFWSARVTLARALLAVGLHDEARVELDAVATEAPDNIAAKRAMEEWHRLTGTPDALSPEQHVLNELEAWLAAIRADRSTDASVNSGPENPARP